MSLPRYPEYKDSEFEWLGALPSHWNVRKFRHSFQESAERIDGEVIGPMLSVSGYRGIEIKDYDDENRRRTDEELQGYRIVRPGQLVVNTMWLNYAGLGVSPHEGHVSPAYRAYSISKELEPRFVHHMMRSGEFVKGYTKFLTGIRPNSLQMSRDDLMEFRLAEPPRGEQIAIADFLDHETAKIDALIAEQEKLLALLAEKRQATISQAVTRGIDPHVPMKDSGIPWLGEVPAHWQVTRLRHVCESISTGPFGTALGNADYVEGGVPVINPSHIVDSRISPDPQVSVSPQLAERLAYWALEEGDIVAARRGELGRAAVAGRENNGWICGTGSLRLRVTSLLTTPAFIHAVLQSRSAREWLSLQSVGSTMANLNEQILGRLPVAMPRSTEEQDAVVSELTNSLNAIADVERHAVETTQLLLERRHALIAAAVTGQIDVRGAAGQAA